MNSLYDRFFDYMTYNEHGRGSRNYRPRRRGNGGNNNRRSGFDALIEALDAVDFLEERAKKKKESEKKPETKPLFGMNGLQWFAALTFFGPIFSVLYLYMLATLLVNMAHTLEPLAK